MNEFRSQKSEVGIRKSEVGLRPLRAVGLLYELEAIGAYAYAPVGMWNINKELTPILFLLICEFSGGI
jgi:hypothetical protein